MDATLGFRRNTDKALQMPDSIGSKSDQMPNKEPTLVDAAQDKIIAVHIWKRPNRGKGLKILPQTKDAEELQNKDPAILKRRLIINACFLSMF
jgi:hypothetical protein